MELRQLACLVAVADEGGFTSAAKRLHLAQPGVSAQVGRLERELGQRLLDRSDRRVRPTQAGAAVLPYARAALAAVGDIRRVADEQAGLLRGRVAVGMVTACTLAEVPAALARFHAAHPGVEISLREANSDQMIEQLRSGDLDLALIGLAGPPPADLLTHVVADEPIVAAVAKGDRLAGRPAIEFGELCELPVIVLPEGTGIRAAFDQICQENGLEPHVAFESTSPSTLVRLASEGLGVAILARSIAEAWPEDVAAISVTHPEARSRLALAWHAKRPASPAASALAEYARRSFARDPGGKQA